MQYNKVNTIFVLHVYINCLQTQATLYSHGTGQIFDWFKSLTGQVVHTGPLNIWALFPWNFEWLGIYKLFVGLNWFHVNGTTTCKCMNFLPVEHSSSAKNLSGKSVLAWLCSIKILLWEGRRMGCLCMGFSWILI